MMIRFNKIFRGFTLALAYGFSIAMAGGTTVRAEEQNGGVPGDWLSQYESARSMGIGGAFVAAADEPLGVIWNPAGLSQMDQNTVHFETVQLFEGTSINGFGFGMPGRRFPSVGITVLHLGTGDFIRTNDLNEPLGTFNEGETAFLLSAAKSLKPEFTLGANVKVIHQSIAEFKASGVGIDVGLIYNLSPSMRLGASLLNLGGPNLTLRSIDESFPAEFRGGLSMYLFDGRGLITAEVDHRSGPGASFHGGSEFWIQRSLALRFGFNDTSPGGGFSYRASPEVRLDYGLSDHELGVTHRIGISYRFGGFFASSDANPPIFSPIGEQSVTRFNLRAKAKSDISMWRLDIVDKSDQVVRSFSGRGNPPAHVMWDGKSETGFSLPDGGYRYWLVVEDEVGREITGRIRTVEITTTGPRGVVPVIIE
jgi:hypothetical protein